MAPSKDTSRSAPGFRWWSRRRLIFTFLGVVLASAAVQAVFEESEPALQRMLGETSLRILESALVGVIAAAVLAIGLHATGRDRRAAVKAIAESESRFQAIADAAPVMIWVVDEHHRGAYFNQGWLKFTGRPLEAELGDGWADTVHPDDKDRAIKTCLAAFHARGPLEMEYRMRRHDGVYRWMQDRGAPRYGPGGEFLGMVGSCFDVTERREAERRHEGETRLAMKLAAASEIRQASRAVTEALAALSGAERSAVLLYGDDGVCRFTGWRGISNEHRKAIEGHCPWSRHAPSAEPIVIREPAQDPGLRQFADTFGREGIGALAFIPVITDSGVAGKLAIYARAAGSLSSEVVAAAQTAARYFGLAVDRLEAQEKLAESEQRRRQMIDTALDAVISMDTRGIVTEWNAQAARTFGWTAAEAVGRRLGDLIVPLPLRAAHEAGLARVAAGGAPRVLGQRIELPALHKNGTDLTVELALVSLETGAGLSFSAFARDITEKKRGEAELVAAKIEAESASRAKSDFLANMSHEIRTPMTAILGFADLLEVEGDIARAPVRRREAVETIKRHGAGLLQILNDILDISKIEAGKLAVERIAIAPMEVLEEVVSLMRVRALAKGISLEAVVDGPIPASIQSDPTRLRQILLNLVGNAVKFTERGGITVRVGLDRARAEAPELRFAVRDTGIGIAPEQLPRLFQAFEQADASVSRRYGGTGLGLRISQRLAEMLGGHISVESELNRGTTFTLVIATGPLEGAIVEARCTRPQGAEQPRRSVDRDRPDLGGKRVLLVEDGPDNQRLISFYLGKLGADVRVAGNGRIAAEAMSADGTLDGTLRVPVEFDLIVMDMQMPELDGYSTTRWLRSRGCDLPIVALTAHAMVGDREKCLDAGCDAYATKPIDRDGLLAVCREAITARAGSERRDAA